MAVTIVVRSKARGSGPLPSLTADSPRLVIGRGDGCDVRLPDPSVSHRHASLRQRGGEHVIVDEGSTNGTFLDKVRLPPQTPRVVRSGERVRVGRVWLEIRMEPVLVKGGIAQASKELALALVAEGLAADGEDPRPRARVVAGPDQGVEIALDADRGYVLGRSKECDVPLEDTFASRRHVELRRRGDAIAVLDLGSASGVTIDGSAVSGEALWRAGQELAIGSNVLVYASPVAEALAEIDRSPDERMNPEESVDPPSNEASPEGGETPAPPSAETDTPSPPIVDLSLSPAPPRVGNTRKGRAPSGGFGLADGVIMLIALGVIVLSVVGAYWVFKR